MFCSISSMRSNYKPTIDVNQSFPLFQIYCWSHILDRHCFFHGFSAKSWRSHTRVIVPSGVSHFQVWVRSGPWLFLSHVDSPLVNWLDILLLKFLGEVWRFEYMYSAHSEQLLNWHLPMDSNPRPSRWNARIAQLIHSDIIIKNNTYGMYIPLFLVIWWVHICAHVLFNV